MRKQCFAEFFCYTSLNILGMLGLSCYILADTYFIARWLGAAGLAALNLAIPIYNLVYGCGLMLGMGGATQYTLSLSRGERAQGNRIFTHTLQMGVGIAVVFMLLGTFCSGGIAQLLGADAETFEMSRTYLRMLLLCSPLFLANCILLCFVRNDGAPTLAMAAMLAGSFSNIFLDYVFIYVLQMGMFGAVFATCLAPAISMLVLSVFFFRRRNHFHPAAEKMERCVCGRILVSGGPSLITELSSGVVMVVFNLLMLRFAGNTGVAAYGVIANLSLVVIAVFNGMAQGIQPLVSMAYGSGRHTQVRWILQYALTAAVLLSLLTYGGIALGAEGIAGIFNSENDPRLQTLAVEGLLLYFTGTAFAGCNVLLSVYFPSISAPKPGNLISLLRGLVLILPLAFLLAHFWGIRGLWLTFPVTEVLTMLVSGICLRRRAL